MVLEVLSFRLEEQIHHFGRSFRHHLQDLGGRPLCQPLVTVATGRVGPCRAWAVQEVESRRGGKWMGVSWTQRPCALNWAGSWRAWDSSKRQHQHSHGGLCKPVLWLPWECLWYCGVMLTQPQLRLTAGPGLIHFDLQRNLTCWVLPSLGCKVRCSPPSV